MCSTESSSRQAILLDTFSFHSFLNAGYFYCWYLSKIYDLVVMVEEKDKNSSSIKILLDSGCIKRLVVLPSRSRRFAVHRWFCSTFPHVLQEVNPSIVLMNNWHAFHQKYISRSVRRLLPNTIIVICLSVHVPITDFETTDYRLREASLCKWRARWFWVPALIANVTYELWGRWIGIRDFFLFPMLNGQRPLTETHNPWLGKLRTKNTADLFDAVLCYTQSEQQGYLMEMHESDKIYLVQHPMSLSPAAVEALFPAKHCKKVIVALPSSCLEYGNSDTVEEQINRLEAAWGPALEILKQKSGGLDIWWKLHPGFVDDPTMMGLTDRLQARIPGFVSKTGKMGAEEMMVSAALVVGDVSSVLIWASRLEGCPVVSLDIFGVEGGDEMGVFPAISVVKSFAELRNMRLEQDIDIERPSSSDALPTPLQCLKVLVEKHTSKA